MYQHHSLINPVRVYITEIIYLNKLSNEVKRINSLLILSLNYGKVLRPVPGTTSK